MCLPRKLETLHANGRQLFRLNVKTMVSPSMEDEESWEILRNSKKEPSGHLLCRGNELGAIFKPAY